MFNYFVDEFYPMVGMPVSAIDGYVGTIVSTHKPPLSLFTVLMESTNNFVDLNLFYVDRISQDHILLNINKHSLEHINIQQTLGE